MEIIIKSLKFDAGEKLIQFTQKKVGRLEKFLNGKTETVTVRLENGKAGKCAKIQINSIIVQRTADTFENAITACVDAMKERLVRAKEKAED